MQLVPAFLNGIGPNKNDASIMKRHSLYDLNNIQNIIYATV
ncbi:hypothetical protein SAMN05428949_3919 [Chitinophaga sp. YR627]|nr:hypothetical protein SAMN05428949_3919 [Chitinophaga sp. YR627]